MDIFDNPFWVLGATTRDNNHRILELAEEKSLILEEEVVSTARSALIHPRKRLEAEMAWLVGLSTKQVVHLISMLQANPVELLEQEGIPSLANANLLAAGLRSRIVGIDRHSLPKWILKISNAYDSIDKAKVIYLINKERGESGFPVISDKHALAAELANRGEHFRKTIRDALDRLDSAILVEVLTEIVEETTRMGELGAPQLIDVLVDTYEVEAQHFLAKEAENIDALLERIKTLADSGSSEEALMPTVEELIEVVKNWDFVAQPIQVSTKSRGLGHDASREVAEKIRRLCLYLFNKHNHLDISKKITRMLQDVFAEVPKLVNVANDDADALEKIAQHKKLKKEIKDLVGSVYRSAEKTPDNAYHEAQKLTSKAPRLISKLEGIGIPENVINDIWDHIAFTVMQCAIIYGNATNNWRACVYLLKESENHAKSRGLREKIRDSWKLASENQRRFAAYRDRH